MALSLVGLVPGAQRSYVWAGDSAVDREHSDIVRWLGSGDGLVLREGETATVFRTEALRPTTLQIVYAHGRMGMRSLAGPEAVDQLPVAMRNMPAVYRAAVAYGVVSIEGAEYRRVVDAGGLRLADETLDALDHFATQIGDGKAVLRLVEHLGGLILFDSQPTEQEKKVS